MSDDFISGSQMITKVFKNISAGDIERSGKIQRAWNETLLKINPNGEKLAAHSFAADLKNGILLVECDHPGWSQTLQMHKKFILAGMNRLSGGAKIESLAFRVKGSAAVLADSEEVARRAVEKYAQKIEAEQKRLEEMGFTDKRAAASFGNSLKEKSAEGEKNAGDFSKGGGGQAESAAPENAALPPELDAIFERMKKSAKEKL